MNRRDLMSLIGAASLVAVTARAQPAVPVIGYLSGRSPGDTPSLLAAFRQGLSQTGYVAGETVAVEYRWAEGNYDRFPALAAELVRNNVDLIVAAGGVTATRAAKAATSTIPVVFFSGGDPVRDGFVTSLARPGGNLTGVNLQLGELTPKRLGLLTELVPQARVVAMLVNPSNVNAGRIIPDAEQAARVRRVQLAVLKASTPGEIDAGFGRLASLHADAVVVGDDPFLSQRREQLVAQAERHAVPAIYPQREFVAAGGLISYAPNFAAAQRLLGVYCGQILKGSKPADLPVQQPDEFELVINLKTAKAIGLTVPQLLLAQADEIIE